MYINAFDKAIKKRKEKGKVSQFQNGQELFDWWMETYKYGVKGQYNLFDEDILGLVLILFFAPVDTKKEKEEALFAECKTTTGVNI